jgi:hypothetical protein
MEHQGYKARQDRLRVMSVDKATGLAGGGRGPWFDSHPLNCAFSFFVFIPHVFIFSYFQSASGMNSMGSLRTIFDRTAGGIKRARDWLTWISVREPAWVAGLGGMAGGDMGR